MFRVLFSSFHFFSFKLKEKKNRKYEHIMYEILVFSLLFRFFFCHVKKKNWERQRKKRYSLVWPFRKSVQPDINFLKNMICCLETNEYFLDVYSKLYTLSLIVTLSTFLLDHPKIWKIFLGAPPPDPHFLLRFFWGLKRCL